MPAPSPVIAFDIETIPDADAIRAYNLSDDPDDARAIEQARARLKEEKGSDFLPLACQKPLVISASYRHEDHFKIASFVNTGDEAKVVAEFFRLIETYRPTLVSWNGSSFDLPVLNLRALVHGISAPAFWDQNSSSDIRYNNYISRYHARHTDLMDVLAMYQARGASRLDAVAKLCGFPGKLGDMDGSQVYDAYLGGRLEDIRFYCETDVVNTHLTYTRYLLLTGALNRAAYDAEIALMREKVQGFMAKEDRWSEFLAAWR